MKPLKLGIIGTGSVVREIYQYLYFNSAYSALIEVTGVCDVDRASLDQFCETYKIAPEYRYTDYRKMIAERDIEAVAVNTPDHLHSEPVLFALEAGLDILLPKPTAGRISEVHTMLTELKKLNRFMGVDYHKRENPQLKEARVRIAKGEYGRLQATVMYMIDKLFVADPNHDPRFFASPDFAEKNSPVSFLTSHMSDSFISLTGLRPLTVRATGYSQKLPSLRPIAVHGYDLVDTEVLFESGCLCHIITGWALPNTAHAVTTQSVRMIFSDGLLELGGDNMGYHEITHSGIADRNILFMNFEENNLVTGFGMDKPGKIISDILRHRDGLMRDAEYAEKTSPLNMGFYSTLICECALESLAAGTPAAEGVVRGVEIDARVFLEQEIGPVPAAAYYKEKV